MRTMVFPIMFLLLGLLSCDSTLGKENEKAPAGVSYVWWDFGVPEFPEFTIDITIHNDIDTNPGIYFQFYQGHIGDTGFYFGLQTNIFHPSKGGMGKGILYSRWGTRDLADVRTVTDGWAQSAGYEGDFVGVRCNYDWTNRSYRFRLNAVDRDEKGVWYGLFVTDLTTNVEDYAGAIRFALEDGQEPKIRNGGGTWLEVYSGAKTTEDVPYWHVSVDSCSVAYGTTPPVAASSNYSKYMESDIYRDEGTGAIHFLMGRGVKREHAKGALFKK